jgi:hypothetical protein
MKFFENRKRKAVTKIVAPMVETTMRTAIGRGWNPVTETCRAVQAECGFPRAAGESVAEYSARAAGVSVDIYERAVQCVATGKAPTPELEPVVMGFLVRVGKRLALSNVPQ